MQVIRPLLLVSFFFVSPALAMVGDAPGAGALGRHVVMIVGSNGTFCTGAAVARDLVLSAVHCLPRNASYKVVEFGAAAPQLKDVGRIERHPAFTERGMTTHRGTADVALVRTAAPLAAAIRPAALGPADFAVKVGDAFTAVGFGVTQPGDPRSGGTARAVQLVATGKPDSMDVRLMDPAARNARPGRGACTGDSGGPVFAAGGAIVGVISWTTGPNTTRGCGGITGMTPLARYRDWIADTARKLGTVLP